MAAVRLATFAALALFAGAHWIGLVDSPPAGRIVLVVVISTCTAALLLALGAPAVRARVHGAVIAAAAVAIGLIGIVLALGAIGLPLRLIGPNNWDELFDGLDRGLAGVQTVEWPYRGSDYWVRLTTLMGGPLLIALAAAVAFFPARRGTAALSWAGLVLLLLAYGSAVTEKDPGAPLLRGLVLLVLVGAWLWLPRLGPREALAGAGLVLALGALSLPVAAALDGDRPWWNYGAWTWLENDRAITFDWNHRYGPLDWPRDGTTLLNVKSDRPHYWKTETLDTFDGIRWVRGGTSDSMHELQGVPDASSADRHWDYFEWNRKWDAQLDFTVRSLSTDLLVSARDPVSDRRRRPGVHLRRRHHAPRRPAAQDGDTYRVRTYDPNPTARQMRNAPGDFSNSLIAYTAIDLPRPGPGGVLPADATDPGSQEVFVPLWGSTNFGDPEAPRRKLESSRVRPHVRHRDPAHVRGADDVRRRRARRALPQPQLQLQREAAPTPEYPLNAFLFRDKFGYCQQFSGAMALMLRMAASPAGWRPASRRARTTATRASTACATWTPTPGSRSTSTGSAGSRSTRRRPRRPPSSRRPTWPLARRTAARSTATRAGAAAELRGAQRRAAQRRGLRRRGVGLAAAAAAAARGRRRWPPGGCCAARVSSTPSELAEAQLAELRRALRWLDWEVPTATTLLGLERRLGRTAGPAAGRYAAALRAHRYDPRGAGRPEPPGAPRPAPRPDGARRPEGPRDRLIAIPPGGPRPAGSRF